MTRQALQPLLVPIVLFLSACGSGSGSGGPGGPGDIAMDPCLLNLPNETDEQAFLQLGGPFDQLKHANGTKMTQRIDSAIRSRMCAEDIAGLGLGIVWHGNLVYVKGYGWERGYLNEAPKVQVRGQRTRFRWASVSKTLTGVAAMLASTESPPAGGPALLDLDQVLSTAPAYRGCDSLGNNCRFDLPNSFYTNWNGQKSDSPDWPLSQLSLLPGSEQITTRLLLANRSGMMHYQQHNPASHSGVPSESLKMANPGFSWAVNVVTQNPLLFEPRNRYNYSSFGFNMAGAVMEERLPDGFWAYLQDKVVNKTHPVEMRFLHPDDLYDPTYAGAPWFTTSNRATGYYRDDDNPDLIMARLPPNDVSWKLPGGGFISTVADMVLFAEGLLNNRFLSQEHADALWTPQQGIVEGTSTPQSGYALGFRIAIASGERQVSHNGRQEAASTRLVIYPDGLDPNTGKLGIVLMSNYEDADLSAMADAIEELLRNPLIPEPTDPLGLLSQSGPSEGTPLSYQDGRGTVIVYNDADLDFMPAARFDIQTEHIYDFNLDRSINLDSPDPDRGDADDLEPPQELAR